MTSKTVQIENPKSVNYTQQQKIHPTSFNFQKTGFI